MKVFMVFLALCLVASLAAARKIDHVKALGTDYECNEFCRINTHGPCQHPSGIDETCFEKVQVWVNLNVSMVCPYGTLECGERPPRGSHPSASRMPSESMTSSTSMTSSPSSTSSSSLTSSPSSSVSPSQTSSISPEPEVEGFELIDGPDGNIVRNTLIADNVVMPQNNYHISFDFTANRIEAGWSNIFHFTANGGNGGGTGRVPALWFYPNQLKFHWICGTAANTNQEVGSSYIFNLHQKYHIDLKVIDSVATIWVDGVVTNGNGQNLGILYSPQTTQFWVGDPWYPAAGANLENFVVYDLSS